VESRDRGEPEFYEFLAASFVRRSKAANEMEVII